MVTTKNVILGWVDAVITIIVFVLVPIYLLPFLSQYVSQVWPNVGWIPVAGIGLAALAFFLRISKDTRYNGVAIAVWGVAMIAYELVLFGFGSLSFAVKPAPGQTVFVDIGFPVLFILLLLIPSLYIVRGILVYVGNGSRPAAIQKPEEELPTQPPPPPPPPEPLDGSVAD